MAESVTQRNVREADIKDAERLEMDADTIMRLVDLIFLCRDEQHTDIPS